MFTPNHFVWIALGIVLLTLFNLPFLLHERKVRTQSLKNGH